MTTQTGLRPTRAEIWRVFTRGGLESSVKNSKYCFLTTRILYWKGSCKSTPQVFSTRIELLTCIFWLFSTGVEFSTRPLDQGCHVNTRDCLNVLADWNSSCEHSLTHQLKNSFTEWHRIITEQWHLHFQCQQWTKAKQSSSPSPSTVL